MFFQLAILAASAAVTVVAVRFLVVRGIEILCARLGWSRKTKGQILGYATSVPELVMVVASARMGVFDAGLWNVVSSNIINWILFLSAVVAYRQVRGLVSARFVDEILFGLASVALPLALIGFDVEPGAVVAGVLVGVFILYKVLDRLFNREERAPEMPGDEVRGGVGRGVIVGVAGVGLVLVAGRFLGVSAGDLVMRFDTPAWLVGWIVGFITSLPEMASFFEVYRLSKKRGQLHRVDATQNVLDALVASNMVNLGVILPTGVLLFLWWAGA
jgi:Ca2+/Na+ antiporter